MQGRILRILTAVICCLAAGFSASAQFRSEAFQQSYNNDPSPSQKDSVDKVFSIKEYFGGLAHRNQLKTGTMFGGSTVVIGGCQIYNQDYWKLPVVYGGIAAGVGAGLYFKSQDNRTAAICSFAGAGLVYWGALLDGVICYKPDDYPQPGKATCYSILCPGLGQAYNGEFWKVPIYVGGMATAVSFYFSNKKNYERFRNIYLEATDTSPDAVKPPISAETAKYYRDVYRRYRDYSVLAIAAVYMLQVIDANVFSYMHDFNVSDDLSMSVYPAVITPDNQYAFGGTSPAAYGLSLGFRF